MSSSTQSSKSTQSSSTPQVPNKQSPCYSHFKTLNGLDVNGKMNCKFGVKCHYSHDEEVYMTFHGLKYCPNNCGSKCKETSKQCSQCTQASQGVQEQRPCYSYFKKGECEFGEKCRYSHSEDVYMAFYELKYCPNCGVGKCKETSKQCSQCTEQWKALREEEDMRRSAEKKARMEEINSRPEQQCRGGRSRDEEGFVVGKGWNCENMTKMDFCKSCHDTQKQYVIKRH